MDVIGQSNVCCTVKAEGKTVYAQCVLMDNQWEAEARLSADIETFIIDEADWEVHKAPSNIPLGCYSIEEMRGKSGYIEGKKELNILLNRKEGEMLKYMLNQCINGLIQAETYLYKQRGFADEEEYDAYWDKIEKNGCRMYTHKSTEDVEWSQYAAPLTRCHNLFNRFKSSKFIYYGGKYMFAYGNLTDSFHRIDISIEFNGATGIITDCEIEFSRAPGQACFSNNLHRKKLIGRNLKELTKKEVIHLLGKSEGCYHLVEVVTDILRTAKYI